MRHQSCQQSRSSHLNAAQSRRFVTAICIALGTITKWWLKNWHEGFQQVRIPCPCGKMAEILLKPEAVVELLN